MTSHTEFLPFLSHYRGSWRPLRTCTRSWTLRACSPRSTGSSRGTGGKGTRPGRTQSTCVPEDLNLIIFDFNPFHFLITSTSLLWLCSWVRFVTTTKPRLPQILTAPFPTLLSNSKILDNTISYYTISFPASLLILYPSAARSSFCYRLQGHSNTRRLYSFI